jgi:hypothetical protein
MGEMNWHCRRGNKSMDTPYALFDPHSAYNALRDTLIPHEKIRGYFHWRRTRRVRGEERPGPSPLRPPRVYRGGGPLTPLKARVTIPDTEPLPERYSIDVTLLAPVDLPASSPCLAFLVEEAVLDRLRALPTPAVVCREGERLTLRDLATGQVRASILVGSGAFAAAVLDEKRVAVRTTSGEVWLWDTVTSALTTVEVAADDPFRAWNKPAGLLPAWQEGAPLEPLACGALRPSLPEEPLLALEQLFDHRLLSEEFAVRQAVAALPELEGRLQGNRIALEADIPPGSPNISDRAWVVVVIDGTAVTSAPPAMAAS